MTEPTPTGANEQDSLVDTLVHSTFVTTAMLNRIGAEHDLSLTQVRVLGILRDTRAGITALAEHLGLEKSTMTGLVSRAEKRGLLRREPHPQDGRAVDIVLTDAGRTLINGLRDQIDGLFAPMTAELTVAEQRRLQTLLQRMLAPRQH
ncbi:MarR family winged helix-turn-helix transcriptional regulator [Nocardia sp. NBC_00511]|uniref:MarR family winged helix-turn-helix transcriptional regulator n=1 Tax=Nocardia sp. NBC_00511 TaxID=2903591 RepID=UPI0030E2752F